MVLTCEPPHQCDCQLSELAIELWQLRRSAVQTQCEWWMSETKILSESGKVSLFGIATTAWLLANPRTTYSNPNRDTYLG
jgi:hypothetical protein